MPTYHSMCPMNCHPTLCGMTVEVEDGKPVSIAGDGDNPDSRGFLCVRGRAASEIVGNDRRLLHPLVRANRKADNWRQAGWDEVLDVVAEKIAAVEPREVAFWTGHGLAVNDYGVGLKWQLVERLANLYGCQRWNPAMTCWGLGGFGLGLTGALETSTKEDMGASSNLILLWGANLPSQPNTARFLLAAKRRGAKILAVDVRETEATAQADETYLISAGERRHAGAGADERDRRGRPGGPQFHRPPQRGFRGAGRACARLYTRMGRSEDGDRGGSASGRSHGITPPSRRRWS